MIIKRDVAEFYWTRPLFFAAAEKLTHALDSANLVLVMADKNYLVELIKELYRLTLLFPKKEPLRYKMRELADDILAAKKGIDINPDLEVLDSFFEVAKAQNWVVSADILNIQAKYSNLEESVKEDSPVKIKSELASRQEEILKVIGEKGKVQVWEIKQILPGTSKRTLRRDFDSMLKQGLVERAGERNNTFYQLKALKTGQV